MKFGKTMKRVNLGIRFHTALFLLLNIAFVLAFSLGVLMFMTTVVLTESIWTKASAAIMLAISAFCLILQVAGLMSVVKYFSNPSQSFLYDLNDRRTDERIKPCVAQFAETAGLVCPTIVTTKSVSNAIVFGMSRDNSILVLSPSFLSILDEDELQCVFLHELFHIQSDVESQSLKIITDKLLKTPLNSTPAFIMYIIAAIAYSVGLNTGTISPFYFPITIYSTIQVLALTLLVIGVSVAVGFLISILKFNTAVIGNYSYVRELVADAFSAIRSRKPMKLYSAVAKANTLSAIGKGRYLDKMSFVDPAERKSNILDGLSFAEIFRMDFWKGSRNMFRFKTDREPLCPLKYRLSLLNLLQQLIYGHLKVTVTADATNPKLSVLIKMPSGIAERMRPKKDVLAKVINYVHHKGDVFNLIECSEELGIDPFDVFLTLVVASNQGRVDIVKSQTLASSV